MWCFEGVCVSTTHGSSDKLHWQSALPQTFKKCGHKSVFRCSLRVPLVKNMQGTDRERFQADHNWLKHLSSIYCPCD